MEDGRKGKARGIHISSFIFVTIAIIELEVEVEEGNDDDNADDDEEESAWRHVKELMGEKGSEVDENKKAGGVTGRPICGCDVLDEKEKEDEKGKAEEEEEEEEEEEIREEMEE